jgi:hypothetical protein
MLQWLYMYVASVCSPCFIYFFRRMLQMRLSRGCAYFTHMLQVFYLDVAHVCNCFSCVSIACFECFSYCVCMLQLFHLDVSKSWMGVVQLWATCHTRLLHLPRRRAWRGAVQQEWRGAGSKEMWGSGAGKSHLCVQQALAWASGRAQGEWVRPEARALVLRFHKRDQIN